MSCHQGYLGFSWRFYSLNRNATLHTVGVGFGRCEHLEGWEGLMKYTIELHYGKSRIQSFWCLTHAKLKVRISQHLLLL